MSKLPDELQTVLENLNPFQRKYCEFRATGLKMGQAAQKAGSNATSKANLARSGFQVEQTPGVKDYILWLQQKRAEVAMVDSVEIIDKLRRIYDQAIQNDKLKEANTSVQLLGMLIGLFNSKTIVKEATDSNNNSNNTEVFKDEEPNETDTRLAKLQQMLKDINK